MRSFTLIHNLNYDITRSVNDMAALFAYKTGAESTVRVIIDYTDKIISARLFCGQDLHAEVKSAVTENISGEITRSVKIAVIKLFSQFTGLKAELPWGILTGVRPGKLVHKLVENGMSYKQLPAFLQQQYLLPLEKGELLSSICRLQNKVAGDKSAAAVYIGIPYCPSKCSYCSFPSGIIPKSEEEQQNFLNFIEQDIINVVKLISMYSLNITSVYIGGGTPTSFSNKVFARLMELVHKYLLLPSVKEFTVEAGRPDCFTLEKLKAMENSGVNRISVNPQTMHDKTLQLIGRKHTVKEFYKAYAMAKNSSIPVINTDLIIGLPGETIEDIVFSLEEVRRLQPQNLTVHTLTLKKGAELFGSAYTLTAQQAEQMVEFAYHKASEMNMRPYYLYRQHYMLGNLANIGYALDGTESIYNIQMMEERHTVIGIGPSSATKVPLNDGHHLLKLNMPKNIFTYTDNLKQLSEKRASLFKK